MFEREGTTASAGVAFWAILFAAVSALMFGWYAPKFLLDYKQPIVDMEGGLNPARTLELIGAYGEAGRQAYLVFLSIDCLFPVTASLFTIAVYRSLLTGMGASEPHKKRLTAVPALSAVCDLVENTCHALITVLYPKHGLVLAQIAWLATAAKYVALSATVLVFVVLVVLWTKQRVLLRSSRS